MPRYVADFLVRCRRCELVYTARLPSSDELSEWYAVYPETTSVSELTTRRFHELLDRFEPFRQTGRLLDVGCGDGHFLAAARQRGWTVYGSEYGDAPRRRAQELGLDVRAAPFQATPDETGSFDVVTAIEVIEHVAEPRAEVAQVRALLRPGGCFYLTTPNFGSLSRRITGARWRAIEYPEHLSLFTPSTLDRLLAAEGLSNVDTRTTGMSPTDIRAGLRPAREERPDAASGPSADAQVRERVAGSRRFDRAVQLVNAGLSRFGLGDTIKALYRLR